MYMYNFELTKVKNIAETRMNIKFGHTPDGKEWLFWQMSMKHHKYPGLLESCCRTRFLAFSYQEIVSRCRKLWTSSSITCLVCGNSAWLMNVSRQMALHRWVFLTSETKYDYITSLHKLSPDWEKIITRLVFGFRPFFRTSNLSWITVANGWLNTPISLISGKRSPNFLLDLGLVSTAWINKNN